MIVVGSMNYTTSGRRKKKIVTKKKKKVEFVPLRPRETPHTFRQADWQKQRQQQTFKKGALNSFGVDPAWEAEKREISQNFTVAPAYNKGAYQVIPSDDVKHIGK